MADKGGYTYFGDSEPTVDGRLIVLTGVTRSGTTLLGKIVSTLEDVEYEFEPWLVYQVPFLNREGLIKTTAAKELLKANLEHIFLNHVLGRNINLRPTDDSVKTLAKPMNEIERRWGSIKNNVEAQEYIQNHNSLLVLKEPNLQPFLDFVYSLQTKVKVIHIVRNAFDVSLSMLNKRWHSDEYLKSSYSMTIRKRGHMNGEEIFVPWWVNDSDIEEFMGYSEYERCLCCWINLIESLIQQKADAHFINSETYLQMRYEDLLTKKEASLRELERFIGKNRTKNSETVISQIDASNVGKYKDHRIRELAPENVERAELLMKKVGY